MLSFSVPVIFVATHWLMFLAVLGIIMVGTAPDFKRSKTDEVIHIGGAYGGIIAAFAYLGFVQGQWWIVGIMAAFTVYANYRLENKTNWIEVAAFYLTHLGLAL